MKKLLLLLSLLIFISCSEVKKIIKTEKTNPIKVYLGFLKNKSLKPKINEILTDSLSKTIITSHSLALRNKKNAEYLIRGTITNYSKGTKIYDYNDVSQMYRINLSVEINILKRKNNKFVDFKKFTINETTIYSDINISKETEENAIERLSKLLSIKIFIKLNKELLNVKKNK